MSEPIIHGEPGPPGLRCRACDQNPSYHPDRRGSESGRAGSSSYSADPDNAWNVNFDDGNVDNDDKDNDNNVRCVRRGTWMPGQRAGREGVRE